MLSAHRLGWAMLALALVSACSGEFHGAGGSSPLSGGTTGIGAPVGSTGGSVPGTSGGSSNLETGGVGTTGGNVATGGSGADGSVPALVGGSPGTGGGTSLTTGGQVTGGASSSGGQASGGQGPVQVCQPDTKECQALTFRTCSHDGAAWNQESCQFVCDVNQGCTGSCVPGASRCLGLESQSCNGQGLWVTSLTCPYLCTGSGACTGACAPGTQDCQSNQARTCDSAGQWGTRETCQFVCNYQSGQSSCAGACQNGAMQCGGTSSQTCTNNQWVTTQTCPYLCTGSGSCTGSCTPGQIRCSGLQVQTCSSQGAWTQSGTCPFVCGGQGVCAGICTPGSTRCGNQGVQTCSSAGQWGAETACQFVCSNGACGGVCVPGQACADDGNACTTDTCSQDGQACLHPAKLNGTACGSQANSSCDNPDSCQAGTCAPNPKPINQACPDDGQVCTLDICNGSGSCIHPAAPAHTVCRAGSCSAGQAVQEATCGGAASCPAQQSQTCYGGCSGNACPVPSPVKIDDVVSMILDSDTSYIYIAGRPTGLDRYRIIRYTKQGSAQTVLYQSPDPTRVIRAMIVAGPFLYFSELAWTADTIGQVLKIDTSSPNQVASLVWSQPTFGFAKNSTNVYWSNAPYNLCNCATPPPQNKIYYIPLAGGQVQTLTGTNNGRPWDGGLVSPIGYDIEADDQYIYFIEMKPYLTSVTNHYQYRPNVRVISLITPDLTWIPLGDVGNEYFLEGGVAYSHTSTGGHGLQPSITKNDTAIFAVFEIQDESPSIVYKLQNLSSSRLTRRLGYGTGKSGMVADNQYVYIGTQRVPVQAGSPTYWTNHRLYANQGFALDDQSLFFSSGGYWNDLPYNSPTDVTQYSLFKMIKP